MTDEHVRKIARQEIKKHDERQNKVNYKKIKKVIDSYADHLADRLKNA